MHFPFEKGQVINCCDIYSPPLNSLFFMTASCTEQTKAIRSFGELCPLRSLLRIQRSHNTIICTIISTIFCINCPIIYVHYDEQLSFIQSPFSPGLCPRLDLTNTFLSYLSTSRKIPKIHETKNFPRELYDRYVPSSVQPKEHNYVVCPTTLTTPSRNPVIVSQWFPQEVQHPYTEHHPDARPP
jgi:hypothetical protein